MIVEICVPCIDKTYDFKLNEDVVLSVVIDEITSVMCQKEQCRIEGDKSNFMLFKPDEGQTLSMNLSLFENGVKTGDSLMLV